MGGEIVFFGIGWMNSYDGLKGDKILRGGSWPKKHEIYNFRPYRQRYWGFVHPTGSGIVKLERLGAVPGAKHVDDVTVVWVAPHPSGGVCVVGWYQHARVFRQYQEAPPGAKRRIHGQGQSGYYASARVGDSVLLDADSRTFFVPSRQPGGKGYSEVWYADSKIGRRTKRDVAQYIREYELASRAPAPGGGRRGTPRLLDIERRLKVEKTAVRHVWRWYASRVGGGYTLRDVQTAKVGWDLEARLRNVRLRIEVKGTSGTAPLAELTPRELTMMNRFRDSYRLCIVTVALGRRPVLHRFSFDAVEDAWIDQAGSELQIERVVSARVFLS